MKDRHSVMTHNYIVTFSNMLVEYYKKIKIKKFFAIPSLLRDLTS